MKLIEEFDNKHKSRETILEKEISEKTSEYEIQIKEI